MCISCDGPPIGPLSSNMTIESTIKVFRVQRIETFCPILGLYFGPALEDQGNEWCHTQLAAEMVGQGPRMTSYSTLSMTRRISIEKSIQ